MSDSLIYRPKKEHRVERHSIRGVDYAVNLWGGIPSHAVYLHGWGDTGATFQFVVDAFENDWFVVAPDFRGFGASHADVSAYWFPDYLADLHELLEIYAPEEPVRLAAHSMGANVAGLYAGSFPERVSALVNIEGFGLPDSDPADAPDRYRRWIDASRKKPRFSTYADFDALAERVRSRSPGLSDDRAAFVARCWGRDRDGRVELCADPLHRLPNAVLFRRAESEACWRAVAAPVQLIVGSESEFAAHADMPFPDVRLHCIDGAGHMLHFDAPDALATTIEQFLVNTL